MNNNKYEELFNTVINNDYCIGCGVCSAINRDAVKMVMNENGQLAPKLVDESMLTCSINPMKICPFSDKSINEDQIARGLFNETSNIKHSRYLGYYLKNYAGYVKSDNYRSNGSSGGFGTWIADKLLEDDLIDAVIHVKEDKKNQLFSYQISTTSKQLKTGSKSKYYPIELSEVFHYVKKNKMRYALIGIPCFIKAFRLLALEDIEVNNSVLYTIGLVCGHLKSTFFAKSIGWELGVHPDKLTRIDFRIKDKTKGANNYAVEVTGEVLDKQQTILQTSKSLYVTNWGLGFFKYNACDYCDDVLAETADISIGDAWLPGYINDSEGNNILTVRNEKILRLIDKYRDELQIDTISSQEIYRSQAGGFRHRREGLSYRLYLKEKSNQWVPKKRVKASKRHSKIRKRIYSNRILLRENSFKSYHEAIKKNDFNIIKEKMNPSINDYKKLLRSSVYLRIIDKLKTYLKK